MSLKKRSIRILFLFAMFFSLLNLSLTSVSAKGLSLTESGVTSDSFKETTTLSSGDNLDNERINNILNKIKENYILYGLNSPAVINSENYLLENRQSNKVNGYIPKGYFDSSGLTKELADDFQNNWNESGYLVNQKGISADKVPNYEDKSYEFVNITVDGVPVRSLGIINLSESDPFYYYSTVDQKDSDISVTILPNTSKFIVNYKPKDYDISYEVYLDGKSILNENNPTSDLSENLSLDYIFGKDRSSRSKDGAGNVTVTIPFRYTGRVYRLNNNTSEKIDLHYKNNINPTKSSSEKKPDDKTPEDYCDLGEQLSYEVSNGEIFLQGSSPMEYKRSAIFYDNDITFDRTIIVDLKSIKNEPQFNFKLFTQIENGRKRGTSGNINEDGESYENFPNVPTIDDWDWSDRDPINIFTMNEGVDGFDYTWLFQTNNSNQYLLDGLELNGVDIPIPFEPQACYGYRSKIPDSSVSIEDLKEGLHYSYAILPDGATVRLDYVRTFTWSNNNLQSVYKLTIIGAKTNITVSHGNLFQAGDGAPEFIPTKLTGVYFENELNNEVGFYGRNNEWNSKELAMPAVLKDEFSLVSNGDPSNHGANIKFRLLEGYTNLNFSWKNILDNNKRTDIKEVYSSSTIIDRNDWENYYDENGDFRPNLIYKDTDGTYFLRLIEIPLDNNKLYTLEIDSKKINYIIEYENAEDYVSSEKIVNWPSYNHENHLSEGGIDHSSTDKLLNSNIDDRNGRYYGVSHPNVGIYSQIPEDLDNAKVFKGWELVNESNEVIKDENNQSIILTPNQGFNLFDVKEGNISQYAYLDNNLSTNENVIYKIKLRAVWEDTPNPFTYTVRLVEDEKNNPRILSVLQNVKTKNIDNLGEGDKLQVYVDTSAQEFQAWLAQNPTYELDDLINNSLYDAFTASGYESLGNYCFKVTNKGTINIFVKPFGGILEVSKEAVGVDDEEQFEFEISADNSSSIEGTYYAWPKNEVRLETNAIPIIFENNKAQFKLTSSETILIYLPLGEYQVSEINSGESYFTTVNGYKTKVATRSLNSIGETADPIKFKNIVESLPVKAFPTIRKNIDGDLDPELSNFKFTLSPVENYGDKINLGNNEVTLQFTGTENFIEDAFEGITFNSEGEYKFLVTEDTSNLESEDGFYSPDSSSHLLSIKVKNNNGKLEIDEIRIDNTQVTQDHTIVEFTNTYYKKSPEKAYSNLTVYKEMVGRDLEAGEFEFIASSGDSSIAIPRPRATNQYAPKGSKGTVDFGVIEFPSAGTYTFTINEVKDNTKTNITFDDKVIKVTYTVEEKEGKLEVTEIHYSDDDTFTNRFSVSDTLTIEKSIVRRAWNENDSYQIQLELVEGQESNITVDNKDNVNSFKETLTSNQKEFTFNLTFDADDSYTYRVRELGLIDLPSNEIVSGINYDSRIYYVTFEVKNGEVNTIISDQNGIRIPLDNNKITFENNYDTDLIRVPILARKDLVNGIQTNNEFTFKLENETGEVVTANSKYGDIVFNNLVFNSNDIGTHTYFLSEVPGSDPTIHYDPQKYTITITIGRDSKGFLTSDIKYSNGSEDTEVSETNSIPVFVNTKLETGSLKISKTVEGDQGDTEKVFNFSIELINSSISGTFGDIKFEGGKANFKLKHGESKTVKNLPSGLSYIVSETEANQDGYTTVSTNEIGAIENDLKEVNFVNSKQSTPNVDQPEEPEDPKTGNLKITKVVSGTAGETNREFAFTVTLSDTSINDTFGDLTFTNGVAQFTLKHGESKIANNLPAGITYTVEETRAGKDGYKTTSTGANGAIKTDETVESVFTNTKNEETKPDDKDDPALVNDLYIKLSHKLDSQFDYHTVTNKINGDKVYYQIEVGNRGNTVANNVVVENPLPEKLNLSKESVKAYKGKDQINPYMEIDTNLKVSLGSVAPGEVYYINYEATPESVENNTYWINHAYILNNALSFSSNQTAKTNSVNNDSASVLDVNGPNHPIDSEIKVPNGYTLYHSSGTNNIYKYSNDVAEYIEYLTKVDITKEQEFNGVRTTGPVSVIKGEEITYYITATNTNNYTLTNITITDNIPYGLTVIEDSITMNGKYSDGTITWLIDSIEAGGSVTVSFTAVINVEDDYIEWINSARLDSTQVSEVSNEVVAYAPEVIIEKEQSTSKYSNIPRTKDYIEFIPGDIVTYYLTVTNVSKTTATNLIISDYIPDGLTLLDDRAATTGMIIEGNYFYWILESLAPGESVTYQVSFALPETLTEKVFYKNIGYVDWEENGNEDPVASNEVIIGDPPQEPKEDPSNPSEPENPNDSNNSPSGVNNNPNDSNNSPSGGNNNSNESPNNSNSSSDVNNTVINDSSNNSSVTTNTSKTVTTSVTTESPKTGITDLTWLWIIIAVIGFSILIRNFYFYKKNE